MKNPGKIFSLAIIMVLFSCSKEPMIDVSEESETLEQSAVFKSAANQSTVPIKDHTFDEIQGASSDIHRNKNGITVNFKTKNLIPNNAYTLWWVVFGDAPGPPTVTYAAGHIAGGSGTGNFSSHKSLGASFNNPLSAEVHLVLHTHGPAVPGMIPDQILTWNEGCLVILPSGPGILHEDSDELGRCADIQFAVHPPVN
jgi:hypothetical protein